jgi:D-aminoacyl-tRNA deacylase
MRAVVQRVKNASVSVDGKLINEIGTGLLVFAGFGKEDSEKDMDYMIPKIAGLRVFPDAEKESSLSVTDIKGEILLISQFTLYGDVKKGKRPSFTEAMEAEKAENLYNIMFQRMKNEGLQVKNGVFQAMMSVKLENWGPYTILLESKDGKAI